MRWLESIIDSTDMSLSKLWEGVNNKETWHAAFHGSQRVGYDLANDQQQQKTHKKQNSANNHVCFEEDPKLQN